MTGQMYRLVLTVSLYGEPWTTASTTLTRTEALRRFDDRRRGLGAGSRLRVMREQDIRPDPDPLHFADGPSTACGVLVAGVRAVASGYLVTCGDCVDALCLTREYV